MTNSSFAILLLY